ncbi:hypothetical protein GCM10010530_19280 [Kribbella aluminosa]
MACARGLVLCGLTLAGAAALLGAPVLAVAAVGLHHPDGPGSVPSPGPGTRGQYDYVWLGLAVLLVSCSVVGMRWVTGRIAWPAGAVPLAPPVLALAAVGINRGTPTGGRSFLCLGLAVLLVPCGALGTRWVAGLTRRLVGAWCGVPIAVPYRPAPGEQTGRRRWIGWLLTDPATWRDLMWTAVNTTGGCLLVAVPAALLAGGPGAMIALQPTAWLAVPLGLALMGLGLWAGPRLLPAYGEFARSMLGPNRQAELALRVRHLAQTRSATIDAGAAQMRRIERDLHDGAQARLVAMGMTLDAAEELVETSPQAARALLAEARDSSVKALAELRDLVRGIHPPMLADRGLVNAVHGLALDLPLRVHFAGELPGRPPAPVESAAYFAVSELLANVSKHARAGAVWIDIGHTAGTLRIGVTDDGRGGADPAQGTGLRGLEQRLAAFDGILAVSSPPGGPTMVNLEIPCALSLPKTSSC